MPVEVVQHSAAVEEEGGLQHLLVDLFIVQFLLSNDRAVTTTTLLHAKARTSFEHVWRLTLNMSHSVQITSAWAPWQAS